LRLYSLADLPTERLLRMKLRIKASDIESP
jgi:hypothetical protein